ncbi:hypothetical protein ACFLQ1_00100 [Candidatus Auribacterota bacterium]
MKRLNLQYIFLFFSLFFIYFFPKLCLGKEKIKNVKPQRSKYQFAREYTTQMLLKKPDKLKEFIHRFLKAEGHFHQPGIGYNGESGLTHDGYALDVETGNLSGAPRNWSAPSKEANHLTILSLAVKGNSRISLFVSPENPKAAVKKAIDLLNKKITSYEKFVREYPVFGGFPTWFVASDTGLDPAWDWSDRIPGLDNGQFCWALFLTADILEQQGYLKLASRYRAYLDTLIQNLIPIFYDPVEEKIRGITKIEDVKALPQEKNYSSSINYFLSDPYEGELMLLFVSIFAPDKDKTIIEKMWRTKKVNKGVYHTKRGERITVRQGYWYSSHEMWAFLILPYRDIPLINEIFLLGEKARTYYSAENSIPGLLASANTPFTGKEGYIGNLGVPSLATSGDSIYQHMVAPYAAFPTILADFATGVVWLHLMVSGNRMLGPYGATEAVTIDGKKITPLVSWDEKGLKILSLAEGSVEAMREALKRAKKYQRFIDLVQPEYKEAFTSIAHLEGRECSYQIPTSQIPFRGSDFKEGGLRFKSYKYSQGINLLSCVNFIPSEDIEFRHDTDLIIYPSTGWIWTYIPETDLKKFTHFYITCNTLKKSTFWLEIKNKKNQSLLAHPNAKSPKICIHLPDTKGKKRKIRINLKDKLALNVADHKGTIIAISDIKGGRIEISNISLLEAKVVNISS